MGCLSLPVISCALVSFQPAPVFSQKIVVCPSAFASDDDARYYGLTCASGSSIAALPCFQHAAQRKYSIRLKQTLSQKARTEDAFGLRC